MRHHIAVFMLISLTISTTSVLLLFRQALEPVETAGAPQTALGVVRSYVSDLNAFFRGGELGAVMDSYDANASVHIRDEEASIDSATLETGLLAIRSSYPGLTVSLGETRQEGDELVVELAAGSPDVQTPDWITFSPIEDTPPLVDAFRVAGGLIVEHQSSLLGLPATHLHDSSRSEMRPMLETRLASAHITLPARQVTVVPVPGPATLFVREGHVEVAGSASDFIAMSPSQTLRALSTGDWEDAGMGAMIVSTVSGVSIRNPASEPARLDVIALPSVNLDKQPGPQDMQRAEHSGESLPLETRLSGALLMTAGGTTVVDDLVIAAVAHSRESVGIGSGMLQVAFVSLSPGMSARIDGSGGAVTLMPLQGASSQHVDGPEPDGSQTVINDGASQVRVLVARYVA